jgi:adenylate cyclase
LDGKHESRQSKEKGLRMEDRTKKFYLNPWISLVTLAIVIGIRIWDPSFVESVRLRYFDTLVTGKDKTDVPVHTVNIDEAALEKYGQWPFPRNMYAEIINDLYKREAGLVVFNVLMPEADRFKQDLTLSTFMKDAPVVIPAIGHTTAKNAQQPPAVQVVGQDPQGKVVEYPGLIMSVAPIAGRAAGIGVVNTFPEIDGVVRRMPLVIASQEKLYPALALETIRVAAQDPRVQVKIGDMGVEALRVPKIGKIETDNLSRIWIDWSKRPTEHSLAKLPDSFKGEIVIVGLAAPGLVNPIATAAGEVWPQVLQGTLVGTMLTQSVIKRPGDADLYELGSLLVAGLLMIFLMRWTYIGIFTTGVIIYGGIAGSIYAYKEYQFLFDASYFAVALLLVAMHAYVAKFLTEFLQKQQIKKQFSSYLSPDLVAKLVKDPSLLKLGGEEKELSIMFTDVRGFTSISEHYGKDVQGLTKIMNRYMTAMTKKILENHGTLDKYIGDAQMAFWNSPLDDNWHCRQSVKAALEMLGNLKEFNDEIKNEGTPAFGMGIGINTGIVVVGNMGSEQRFDYTCLGDAVNLASRLEGQSKNYGVMIVLGPVTASRLDGQYFTLELDCIAVKGKKEGVNIHTVFYNPPDNRRAEWDSAKQTHDEMLAYYRNQQWNKAIKAVESLKGKFDGQMDHYYELWLERIQDMASAGLPPDWDGVYRATSK